ncbi:MAG: hypothetical protein H6599_02000 [Flavobacteriales bacterium]|nr:hypothetical protein [Flavobacteriales bacterium]
MNKGDKVRWTNKNIIGTISSLQDFQGLKRVRVNFVPDEQINAENKKRTDEVNFGFKSKWIHPEELEMIV